MSKSNLNETATYQMTVLEAQKYTCTHARHIFIASFRKCIKENWTHWML